MKSTLQSHRPLEPSAGALRERAAATLAGNWREGALEDGTPYAYTCPSPERYRHQWYWDSCFHAIVWARLLPQRGRDELRTLLRAQAPDGLIPHTIFWEAPPRWRRAPFYATQTAIGAHATASTQTPIAALAWEAVAIASVDEPGFAAEGLPALRSHYDWLDDQRDPDRDGLISIIFPDESGVDDSPKYDGVFGWKRHYMPGYFWLVERARRLNYDAREIIERYDEHVEDVLVNVFYALSLHSLARLLGPVEGAEYERRAERTEAALLERCWDEEAGLFWDLAGREERQVKVSTWSSLAPLALPSLPERIGRRIIEEQLLDPRRYLAPIGVPSVSRDSPSFRRGFSLYRVWRGPSWVNTAWLLVPAMRRLGYELEANRILTSLMAAVDTNGFREYYDPLSGRGMGARDFSWSTLLVDLLEPA